MNAKPAPARRVMAPAEAAGRLGVSTGALTTLIRRYKYDFTELSPGGKPGDKGRKRWGLTEEQLETILRGQERRFRDEPEPAAPVTAAPTATPFSPDGRSRLRRGRART